MQTGETEQQKGMVLKTPPNTLAKGHTMLMLKPVSAVA